MVARNSPQKEKVHFRSIRSRLKKKLRNGSKLTKHLLSKYHLSIEKHSSPIDKFDIRELRKQKLNELLPPYNIKVPKVLCMVNEAEGTLIYLDKLKIALEKDNPRHIFVDHSETEYIGLSASWIFDKCISELKLRVRSNNKRFYLKGKVSQKERSVNNFLLSFGLLSEMGINPLQIVSHCDLDYFSKFQTRKIQGNKLQPKKKGLASAGLAKYFDSCLLHFNKCLTTTGVGRLASAFGEIIGNAEEHTDVERNWHSLACFEKETGYAHFAIISQGASIFETLSAQESTAKEILQKVQESIESQRSILSKASDSILGSNHWEETVWTVMALQEGISSKRDDTDDELNTHGQGMMDFLEFIDEAKDPNGDTEVVIISGHSYVKINLNKYKIKDVPIDGEERRQICFNSSGKLDMPQDKTYVYPLKHKLKGTIITGRLKLTSSIKQPEHRTQA